MDDKEVDNKCVRKKTLKINEPNGNKIGSIHVCIINVLGHPMISAGHIVPSLKISSLIGIRSLCRARYKVVFDNEKCQVIYNNKIILTGSKDPSN